MLTLLHIDIKASYTNKELYNVREDMSSYIKACIGPFILGHWVRYKWCEGKNILNHVEM